MASSQQQETQQSYRFKLPEFFEYMKSKQISAQLAEDVKEFILVLMKKLWILTTKLQEKEIERLFRAQIVTLNKEGEPIVPSKLLLSEGFSSLIMLGKTSETLHHGDQQRAESLSIFRQCAKAQTTNINGSLFTNWNKFYDSLDEDTFSPFTDLTQLLQNINTITEYHKQKTIVTYYIKEFTFSHSEESIKAILLS